MIKQLFLMLWLFIAFTVVNAQSKADSVVKAPMDTAFKKRLADSVADRPAIDTSSKLPATTIKTDTSKPATDSLAKHPKADSAAKKVSVKHHADSKIKRLHTDSVAKSQPVKALVPENKLKHSTVKTLNDERYNMLVKGEDFDNMALAGEMNHYPSPDQALKYKVELGLNPGQLTKLKDISMGLHHKRIEMGENIVKNEKMLDTLFQTKQAADGTIIFYTNRYGLYMGEIRNAVLQACLKTRDVLSEAQIKKLEGLESAVK